MNIRSSLVRHIGVTAPIVVDRHRLREEHHLHVQMSNEILISAVPHRQDCSLTLLTLARLIGVCHTSSGPSCGSVAWNTYSMLCVPER